MLKELEKLLGNEKKDHTIFDIVLYGSSVKGATTPRDLDIAVLFREGTLKERLSKIQGIKKRITVLNKNVDIKGILLEELFQKEFFGRSGLIIEGISLLDRKSIASKLSLKGFVLFTYRLKDKTHTQKVKFNYILSGRNGEGIVKKMEGEHVSPGTVIIPINRSLEFEDVLKTHTIDYSKKRVLVEM